MAFRQVEYKGVHFFPPEDDACLVFSWSERRRILPIWVDVEEGIRLSERSEHGAPRRPLAHDVLIETINRMGGSVEAIRVVSYYEGVFICSLVLDNQEEIDCRPSDAIAISELIGVAISVDDEVLNQASVFVPESDMEAYLGFVFPKDVHDELDSDPTKSQADAEFSNLMESLGVSEQDLLGSDDFGDDSFDLGDS
ncbi:bifunctional nuclease family protein [Corynebacterium diphtheriae]|nr:bifunctional nuclease family protein [Corynebacterium diphtheriae]CAB0705423.1 bifunctional nuclease family protein [Corynebacterium diphtheriae]CAB0749442.1 bifunctional nuclease family protein [Corynebacterium diphtheriae]CAB0750663.1 bifunctional nuclease family protein [Corynebacterium diphtheriae]CAB0772472.1 bifunctional nuclease family protein [Corynebacterium diphtheriae]